MEQNNINTNQGFMEPVFDYSPSILPLRKGEPPTAEPCTRQVLEAMMDDQRVVVVHRRIEALMQGVTAETPHERMLVVKEEVNRLKKQLPVIIPGAHSLTGHRRAKSPKDYVLSPLVTLDVDGIDHPRELWEERIAPHVERLKIMLAYVTPSTRGLKLIALRPDGLTAEQAMAWLAGELGIEDYDRAVKDPLRAHYMVSRNYVLHYDADRLFDPALSKGKFEKFEGFEKFESATPQPSQPSQTLEPSQTPQTSQPPHPPLPPLDLTYCGIPLSEYVGMYWKLHYGGREPVVGDRATKTFELASQLRYICNNSLEVLDQVIPCYADFPAEEKLSTLRSAVSYDIKTMPRKIAEVVTAIKRQHTDQPEVIQAFDEQEEQDLQYYIERLDQCFAQRNTKLPMGIRDSLEGVQRTLHMPMLVGIGPFIGALATKVRLQVHDEWSHLNLIAYIVGEAASGKSKLDALYRLWCHRLIQEDDVQIAIMNEWKALPTKQREKTPRPVVKIRLQPLRCSMADVLDHLNNSEGKHLVSFSSEADQLSQSRRSGAFADVGVLLRMAFDGAEFRSSYAGSSAINANIKETLWNMTLATTPDGLHRATPNVTDGEQTRKAIASMPDNTFSRLVRVKPRSTQAEANIRQVADLLALMGGDVELPLLEEACERWLEAVRKDKLKDHDLVFARQRFRVSITAMRYTCCLMLCAYAEWLLQKLDHRRKGSKLPAWAHNAETAADYLRSHPDAVCRQLPRFQTEAFMQCFSVLADYLIDTTMYYFRDRLEAARQKQAFNGIRRKHRGPNDTVFDLLPNEFTLEDARRAKGPDSLPNAAKQMVKHWCENGLCLSIARGRYRKIEQEVCT